MMYRTAVEQVPEGDVEIPLGQARIARQGTDVSLVAWGQQVKVMEQAVRFGHGLGMVWCGLGMV